MLTMENLYRTLVITTCGIVIAACSPEQSASTDDFEKQVEDYIQKFPYQETFDYAMRLTGGDAGKLNQWGQASRDLLKAGEDSIVRVNNDTLYKTAFIYLGDGPVVLRSDSPSQERFSSFQLQDDRNEGLVCDARIGPITVYVNVVRDEDTRANAQAPARAIALATDKAASGLRCMRFRVGDRFEVEAESFP